MPICATNTLYPPNNITNSSFDGIPKTASKEFIFVGNENILRNSLNVDKNITLLNHPLPHYTTARAFDTTSWQLSESLLEKHKIADADSFRLHRRSILDENVKIHNDFHYGINKSNQENNFYNNKKQEEQQQTPSLLSNIKNVNSSSLSSLTMPPQFPSTSSATATATTTHSSSTASSSSSSSSYFERVEMQESLTHTKNEKLLLHRNKRYLLFPEGSSFQLGELN